MTSDVRYICSSWASRLGNVYNLSSQPSIRQSSDMWTNHVGRLLEIRAFEGQWSIYDWTPNCQQHRQQCGCTRWLLKDGLPARHYLHVCTGVRSSVHYNRRASKIERPSGVFRLHRSATRQENRCRRSISANEREEDMSWCRRQHCIYNASFLTCAFEHRKLSAIAIWTIKRTSRVTFAELLFGAVVVKSNAFKNT